MRWISKPLYLSAGLLACGLTNPVSADNLVAVSNSASPDYTKKREAEGAPNTETCIFMPGQFFEGNIRDRGLEKTKFIDIARTLAMHLRKNSYLPAKNFGQADLLLVVHWGVTIGSSQDREMEIRDPEGLHDLRTMAGLAPTNADIAGQLTGGDSGPLSGPSSLSYEQDFDFRTLETSTNQIDTNRNRRTTAAMLGFYRELKDYEEKPFVTERTRSLMTLLESDRYFLIVIAYDWQRWLTEKKMVRLWTSRLSIRSPGVNFGTAVQRMSLVGSNWFGTSTPEVMIAPAKKRKDTVTSGELLFIGYDQPKEPTGRHDADKNNGPAEKATEPKK